LPTLCKKKDVPYIIVKGKAALGRIVHKKTAAAVAITDVKKAHQKDLDILVQKALDNYNSRYSDTVKRTGGQIMGAKHLAAKAKLEKQKAKEAKGLNKI
jgi:large subunit ribosomal protein L7Ae